MPKSASQGREVEMALAAIAEVVIALERSRKVSRAAAYAALMGVAANLRVHFDDRERAVAEDNAGEALRLLGTASEAVLERAPTPEPEPAAEPMLASVIVLSEEDDPLIRAALLCMQIVETTSNQWSIRPAVVLGAFDAALRVLAHDDHQCGDPNCASAQEGFRQERLQTRDRVMQELLSRVRRSNDRVMH